jgi:phosphoribosyl 1,2-cyclic phosphate phosphodiesterase
MQLTFLGTAAAESYPSAFCRCENCERARALGGASLRKRSAALVDDELLIDLGPDVASSSAALGRPLTGVRHCLQTHAHTDHFDPLLILSRGLNWGIVGRQRLALYASAASLRRMDVIMRGEFGAASFLDPAVGERLNLAIHPVEPLRPFDAGRYRVTPFQANHDPVVEPLLYAIAADGRCIFYGTDTTALPEETWRGFHQHRLRFDLVILDHTFGEAARSDGHLNARLFAEQVARLREEGLLNAGARIFAQHISHADNPPHPDLVVIAARRGYDVAYDGLTV